MGALVALVTSYRRQRIDELAGERAERAQVHTEKVARATIHDATERRVTELYGRAVEQLGHEKATVRLGGLYSLERLAQHNEDHRQVVVEVICAYLRMPYMASIGRGQSASSNGLDAPEDTHQELQVRKAAQEVLARHSRPEPLGARFQGSRRDVMENPLYWPKIAIDLSGACLVDVDFSECFLSDIVFDDAVFIGQSRFSGAVFIASARLAHAKFKGYAAFDGVEFLGHLALHDSAFEDVADFRGAGFRRQFALARATFKDEAWFADSCFHADVRFENPLIPVSRSTFRRAVNLDGARVLNQGETVMLPTGWHAEPDGEGRRIVRSSESSPAELPLNIRPPYPRLDQDPDMRWQS
ncbi:pentapeptide repeat-containing protein [Streptomyces microflavus]|uniref:pentapeptide repeat-containing protein n=1 Tax=Streptomyces microflavus TaxID=1919 RepID=UPI0038184C32